MQAGRGPRAVALVATILTTLVVGSVAVHLENRRHAAAVRTATVEHAAGATRELEQALGARLVVAEALVAYDRSTANASSATLDTYVERLVGDDRGIRGLMLAPGLVIDYVWPRAIFGSALGINLDRLPVYQDTLTQTLENGELVLVGPIPAPLEVEVLVAAMPIGAPEGGLAIVLLDHQDLLGDTSVTRTDGTIRYAIRVFDAVDPDGRIVYGDRSQFGDVGVRTTMELPGARWELAASPAEGWPTHSPAAVWMLLATLMLAGTAAALVSRRYSESDRLRVAVAEATVALRASNSRYEAADAELRRYAQRLEGVNDELRALDRMRADFVAVASHEVRTPLTAIQGFVDTLVMRWDTIPDVDRKGYLTVVQRQTARLSQLVTNVMQIARLESGSTRARVGAVPLAPMLTALVDEHADTEAIPVQVTCPESLHVTADPVHLPQILGALLRNALTYGGAPYAIDVSLDGAVVVITVRDHGPGVPEEFRGSLFEKFAQASTGTTRTARGTGLGLAIARGLARIQGGDLEYRQPPGGGAEFALRLPLAEAPNGPSQAADARADESAGAR